jgi:hypothetical protein
MRRFIRPAAAKAGITQRIGWHTFRHYAEFRTMPNVAAMAAARAYFHIDDSA